MTTQAQLNDMGTEKLVELFEETDKQKMTPELGMVRGWIIDVLEQRDAQAFETWIFSGIVDDSPREFFIKETR
jgi:hypothetical protein